MKIATWNLKNLYDPGTFIAKDSPEPVTEPFFNKRVEYFTEKLRPFNFDIIFLQEVGGEKGVSLIGDALGYGYFFARPNGRGIRMAILYKKALTASITCESVSLGELFIPGIKEQGDTETLHPITQRRDILVIDINDYPAKKLRFVNLHLKSLLPIYLEGEDTLNDSKAFTDAKFRAIFYKLMELRGLRVFADKSFNEGRDLIFLGDFNENNKSSVFDILKSSNQEGRRLSDVSADYKGRKATHIYQGNDLTFDTMLVSKGVKEIVESISIENKDLQDYSGLSNEEDANIVESDHALVWMEIN